MKNPPPDWTPEKAAAAAKEIDAYLEREGVETISPEEYARELGAGTVKGDLTIAGVRIAPFDKKAPPMTVLTPPRPRLFLSQDADYDWLTALEFGVIDDGQPDDRWTSVGGHVRLLYDEAGERCLGFRIGRVSEYDPDAPENAALGDGPRFDVPALGLSDVTPNAIVVATRALFGNATTVNRELFDLGTQAQGDAALRRWLRCLQAGDSMAHFGLGYTLYELGRHQEAYRHLRHYAEIAPAEPWSWGWYGRAAAAVGETAEARDALSRAIELDADDEAGARTDAQDLLKELEDGTFAAPEVVPATAMDAVLETLIRQLVREIGESLSTALGENQVHVLVDLRPPVWVHVETVRGDVTIRAQVGTVAQHDLGDDELEEMVAAMATHHALEFDDESGDLYVLLTVPAMFAEHDSRTGLLRPLVHGAAVCAQSLPTLAELHDIEILPPRGAIDEYEHFVNRDDD